MLAEAAGRRKGLYLAFNKSIAEEAKSKLPRAAAARTAHSVAYGWMKAQPRGEAWLQRLRNSGWVHPTQVARFLGTAAMTVPTVVGSQTFSAEDVGRWALETTRRFMQSGDDALDPDKHFPLIEGVEIATSIKIAHELTPPALRAWEELCDPTSTRLKAEHEVYLKLWSLSCPQLDTDYVMFDEAQDASPVIAKVVLGFNGQKVVVGDPAQSIYGFTGAVDAMGQFDAPHRLALTQSWRFGDTIARAANSVLSVIGQPLRLIGNPAMTSHIGFSGPVDAMLCRGNAGTIAAAFGVQQRGQRVHIVGGVEEQERLVQGAEQLQATGKTSHPELKYFKSWEEVRAYAEEKTSSALIRTMTRLVDQLGTNQMLRVLRACARDERDADVVVSTVHKAKGREWARVGVFDDFSVVDALDYIDVGVGGQIVREGEKIDVTASMVDSALNEFRVGYVALTRAQLELEAPAWAELLAGRDFPAFRDRSTIPAPPESVALWTEMAVTSDSSVLIEFPLAADLWTRLLALNADDADMALESLTEFVDESLRDAINRAEAKQSSSTSRGRRREQAQTGPGEYPNRADEVLGEEVANQVRTLIDAAAAKAAAAAAKVGDFGEEYLFGVLTSLVELDGIEVHRRAGQRGFSVTTTLTGVPVRVSGSDLGGSYSGPKLLGRMMAMLADVAAKV
ncbi:DNA-binding protein [Platysternon megacephalum]|uniref:DNA-binding protein n=1 Tax=Platysternon megacephalum TaxID=55544 RepID=A0A4D9DJN8_9SAUR|nr:DNA-binding protein [Platysternon megacephalum]